jgi:hypothetical protein
MKLVLRVTMKTGSRIITVEDAWEKPLWEVLGELGVKASGHLILNGKPIEHPSIRRS